MYRKFFWTSLLLSTLIAESALGSTTQLPILDLSMQFANKPKLDLSVEKGPITSKTESLLLQFDPEDVAQLFEIANKPRRYNERSDGSYSETRNYRDPTFMISLSGPSRRQKVLKVVLEQDSPVQIELPFAPSRLQHGEIRIPYEIYRCNSDHNCEYYFSSFRSFSIDLDSSLKVVQTQNIFSCSNGQKEPQIIVSTGLINQRNQNITIKDPLVLQHLGIRSGWSGRGDRATSLETFKGFAAYFDSYYSSGSVEQRHVFADHGGLKITRTVNPYYWCHYVQHGNYPQYQQRKVTVGRNCPYIQAFSVSHTEPGNDQSQHKEYFFSSCEEL